MIPIVIDTESLKRLVNHLSTDRNISILENWVSEGAIQVLAPEVLKSEWFNKHREEELNKPNKQIAELEKQRKRLELNGIYDISPELEPHLKLVKLQVEFIDQLLKSSPNIPNDRDVVFRIEELSLQNTRPFFHRTDSKKDNRNDASIIFHALSYCKQSGFDELIFVSNNAGEYGSLDKPNEIHPLIQSEYPTVRIVYFRSLNEAVEYLKQKGLKVRLVSEKHSRPPVYSIPVNKNTHLLEQLDEFIEKRFKEWQSLPSIFCINQYPFQKKDSEFFQGSPNTLFTESDELYDLLTGISIVENEYQTKEPTDHLPDAKEKLDRIIRTLVHNGIYFVAKKFEDRIPIPVKEDNYSCVCNHCRWKRMNIGSLKKGIEYNTDDLWVNMNQGYTAYKLGFTEKSIELFVKAWTLAENENKLVVRFLAEYNLEKIISRSGFENISKNNFNNDSIPAFNIPRTIDLLQEQDRVIAKWLYDETFMDEAIINIGSESSRLRRYYRGEGFPSNDSIHYLFEFANSTFHFLSKNCIIYDDLPRFKALFEPFFEGICASLANPDSRTAKLIALSENNVVSMILHGNSKTIKGLLRHYELNRVKYLKSGSDGFATKFRNVVEELMSSFASNEASPRLTNKLLTYFENMLAFSIYFELEDKECESIADSIMLLAKMFPKNINDRNLRGDFVDFIGSHYPQFEDETLYRFVELPLVSERLRNDLFIVPIQRILKKRNLKYKFSKESVELIIQNLNGVFEHGWSTDIESWFHLAVTDSSKQFRNKLSIWAEAALQNKFRTELFYDVCFMLDDVNKKFRAMYLNKMKDYIAEIPSSSNRGIEFHGRDLKIDEFINYSLKEKIRIEPGLQKLLVSINEYYNWLMNIETFDYSKFDPDWLAYYFTKYYKRYFRKSRALKKYLLESLNRFPTKKIQEIFCEIFG